MSFKENMTIMRERYIESEREFHQFNRIIPHDKNPDYIYSPRLVNLLVGICFQIEGVLELLITEFNLGEYKDFPDSFDKLNKQGLLSIQKIVLQKNMRLLLPYDLPSVRQEHYTPPWWGAYNDVKHKVPHGIYNSTLGNVINALSALWILHCIANTKIRLYSYSGNILDKNEWHDFEQYFSQSYFNKENNDGRLLGCSSKMFYHVTRHKSVTDPFPPSPLGIMS